MLHRPLSLARTLCVLVLAVLFLPAAASAQSVTRFQGESLIGSGSVVADASASNGESLLLARNGTVRTKIGGSVSVIGLQARGSSCDGGPIVQVEVNGRTISYARVTTGPDHGLIPIALGAPTGNGRQDVAISFVNDAYQQGRCDRNVWIDAVGAVVDEPPTDSATVRNLYVDPTNIASATARQWRSSKPWSASMLDKIGDRPMAVWLGGWSGDAAALDAAIAGAWATNSRLVLVLYGIPHRDAGGHSAGGMSDGFDYRSWIDWVASRVGALPTITIVEPDAVAMDVSWSIRQERDQLLQHAVRTMNALPDSMVYLDAGNSAWRTPDQIAERLGRAGLADADGFALNVSNFLTTSSQMDYGFAVSKRTGGKHFVVDTSRNGRGPLPGATGEDAWCNPDGRAIGNPPTMSTGVPVADALIWAKRPGSSDGACRGFPSAGTFMPDVAVGMASRASW